MAPLNSMHGHRPVFVVAEPHKDQSLVLLTPTKSRLTCGTSCAADTTQMIHTLLLNHAKILCSLGDEKVASHAALSALLRRHIIHKTLAHKKSPAQSHVLGAHVQQLLCRGKPRVYRLRGIFCCLPPSPNTRQQRLLFLFCFVLMFQSICLSYSRR